MIANLETAKVASRRLMRERFMRVVGRLVVAVCVAASTFSVGANQGQVARYVLHDPLKLKSAVHSVLTLIPDFAEAGDDLGEGRAQRRSEAICQAVNPGRKAALSGGLRFLGAVKWIASAFDLMYNANLF